VRLTGAKDAIEGVSNVGLELKTQKGTVMSTHGQAEVARGCERVHPQQDPRRSSTIWLQAVATIVLQLS
jgi:hypothetical protein